MLNINTSYKSPNFTNKTIRPEYVVLHCICWPDSRSLSFFCKEESQVSAHFYIANNGDIFQLVDDNKRAWHAGVSTWKNHTNLNDNSIGIELANTGEEFNENEFADVQYDALNKLLKELFKKHDIKPENVLSHCDVAPGRKTDPGAKFAWSKLIKLNTAVDFSTQTNNYIKAIKNFGYTASCEESDLIIAFQRRFLPNNITGKLDKKTKDFINSKMSA